VLAGALAEVLAGATALLLLLLDELEHADRASSAPALAAILTANFLFMHNLLVPVCKGPPEAADL
jgi:hypothetical protein